MSEDTESSLHIWIRGDSLPCAALSISLAKRIKLDTSAWQVKLTGKNRYKYPSALVTAKFKSIPDNEDSFVKPLEHCSCPLTTNKWWKKRLCY